jgi:hypothetical protein
MSSVVKEKMTGRQKSNLEILTVLDIVNLLLKQNQC